MLRPLVFVGVAALLAGASMTADSTQNRPLTGRSQVATRLGIVAASQVLAARAGVQVLERGGNAVDAAIATNAVMGLMEPTSNGIGGDLFALVYEAKTGTLHGLNASGWAPRALTPEYLRAAGVAELPSRGPYTVTVPGVVAGWHSMREKFGRLPMADLLAPAIHYAKEGFPVAEVTAGLWARSLALLEAEPNAARTFLVDGRVPAAGAIFRNPDLARSLARIAERGRDGYYRGPTAEAIVAMLKARGSPMDAQDLAEFDVEWVQPISTTYRGWKVSEIPPNGQGIAALIMLNLMEPFPMGDFGFHSPRALHTMIEAKKLAYADLIRYVGDQRFGEVPVGAMLDKGRAQTRAGRIDPARAQCRVEPVAARSRHRHAGARHHLSVGRRSRRQHGVADPEQLSWALDPGWFPTAPASCSTTAARCSRWRRISPTRLRAASGRCTRSSPASWRRTARGSRLASWAAGTRRRPTRSLSPTSPTSASRRRRRSKRDGSRRPPSRAATCRSRRWSPKPSAAC